MPKSPAHALIWSAENHLYVLHTPDHPPQLIFPGNEAVWCAWLTTHSSFSFQGQHGHLNVLKEARLRGTRYWYAYHRSAGQTHKRYLGHSAAVTLARLEEIAQVCQDLLWEHPLASPSLLASSQAMCARPEIASRMPQQGSEPGG
jgi:LuxR family maltose regulon positive regulatory protein